MSEPKLCRECGEPDKEFEGTRRVCKDCRKKYFRRHAKKPKVKKQNRDYWIKKQYNLNPEEFEALKAAQGGRCKICPWEPHGKYRLDVDHCHETGKVRGLLCPWCNKMLGFARDDAKVLAGGIKYLIEFEEREKSEEIPPQER